jgi:hypothetical protein
MYFYIDNLITVFDLPQNIHPQLCSVSCVKNVIDPQETNIPTGLATGCNDLV